MLNQVIFSGLAMGCIYALVALGYVFVWNTMSEVNFACFWAANSAKVQNTGVSIAP